MELELGPQAKHLLDHFIVPELFHKFTWNGLDITLFHTDRKLIRLSLQREGSHTVNEEGYCTA